MMSGDLIFRHDKEEVFDIFDSLFCKTEAGSREGLINLFLKKGLSEGQKEAVAISMMSGMPSECVQVILNTMTEKLESNDLIKFLDVLFIAIPDKREMTNSICESLTIEEQMEMSLRIAGGFSAQKMKEFIKKMFLDMSGEERVTQYSALMGSLSLADQKQVSKLLFSRQNSGSGLIAITQDLEAGAKKELIEHLVLSMADDEQINLYDSLGLTEGPRGSRPGSAASRPLTADGRWQSSLPICWRKMLKGSREKDGKCMTLCELKSIIFELYNEKIAADVIDKREGREVLELERFVSQYLLLKHSKRKLVQINLWGIIKCTKAHYQEDDWVSTFARFCGLTIDGLGLDAEEMYLWVMKKIRPDVLALPPSSPSSSEGNAKLVLGCMSLVGAEMLLETVSKTFTHIRIDAYATMLQEISFECELTNTEQNPHTQSTVVMVSVDDFMEIYLRAWEEENLHTRNKLDAVFQAYDVDQSGEIDLEEFRDMIQSVCQNREFGDHEIQRLYFEALNDSDTGTMNPEVFSKLVQDQFKLFMSRDVLDELGDETSEVNNEATIKIMLVHGVRNKFNKFDAQGKNALNRQEMSRVLKVKKPSLWPSWTTNN
jgi:Ca2+-binding EF-hand superfamily protein